MNNILIVGGTSDISVEIVKKINFESNIHLFCRNKKKFDSIYKSSEFNNKKIFPHYIDISYLESIEEFSFHDFNQFDKFIFLNGIDIIKPNKLLSINEIVNSFNVNIISTFLIISKLFKYNKVKKNSSFVFLSSISGNNIGPKGHSIYSTTKSAMNGMIKSLSNEYSKRNIRFNSIAPGLIKTKNLFNKNSAILDKSSLISYEKQYPLGFGDISDVVELVFYLLNSKSKWITGQTFVVDGGFTLN
ncbi:MAG: hypothetical protein CL869_00090 [Cytophagia bacterium]|nr:hypothetical protein [Cytophagia bacterium]